MRPRAAGFTLLEVVVAFTIAAFALIVLFRGASGGLLAVHASVGYDEAIARARSHLAAIGRDLAHAPADATGDDGGGYRWHLAIRPRSSLTLPTTLTDNGPAPPPPFTLYDVTVDISWTLDGKTRQVTLQTRRVGMKDLDLDG
jgi:general secretion pathway protein I